MSEIDVEAYVAAGCDLFDDLFRAPSTPETITCPVCKLAVNLLVSSPEADKTRCSDCYGKEGKKK